LRYAEIGDVNVLRRVWRAFFRSDGCGEANAQGFTLLEVMVAVAIMALVLVTLLGLKNRSMGDVLLMQHMTTATMLAKRKMVETTSESKLHTPTDDDGDFPEEEFKDYTWKRTIVPTPFIQIMEVRIAVLWKEGTRQESVELLSYE
jgi:general secretion pathway protein I